MMTFHQQLIITLFDKAAIGGLLLLAGFWLNRLLETHRSHRALENEFAKLRDSKRLDYLEKQLSQFYWPIYMRLQVDNAVWENVLAHRGGDDELRRKVASSVETNLVLPNHTEIVSIIEANIHLAQMDQEEFDAILKFVRHVAVFTALRSEGVGDVDPTWLGEPWPHGFFPLVEKRLRSLQSQYDDMISLSINASTSVSSGAYGQAQSLGQVGITGATERLSAES